MLNATSRESGFSYIDVMIAIVILMVGILAMLSALTANLVRSHESEKHIVAKQMALSTIESIISAKEIRRDGVTDGWDTIKNATGVPPTPPALDGIFLTGWNPVRPDLGWDGVAGTIDDACPEGGACSNPAPEAGVNSNTSTPIGGFQRQIVITEVPDPERPSVENRRMIEVSIRYFVHNNIRNEVMSTIITNY